MVITAKSKNKTNTTININSRKRERKKESFIINQCERIDTSIG